MSSIELRQLAIQLLHYVSPDEDIEFNTYSEEDVIEAMLQFGKQVCDLQIEKCKEEVYSIDCNLMGVPEIIIPTKNICEDAI